jgi:hypothetical protein
MFPFPAPLLCMGASGPAPGILLVGKSTSNGTDAGQTTANFQIGTAFQAVLSGTANFANVLGGFAGSSAQTYRLCVYGATSESSWGGPLLGYTADVIGLGISEVKSIALLTPITIVAGNWYALTMQSDGIVRLANANTSASERFFSDNFADGPAATAAASPGVNSPSDPCFWLST